MKNWTILFYDFFVISFVISLWFFSDIIDFILKRDFFEWLLLYQMR